MIKNNRELLYRSNMGSIRTICSLYRLGECYYVAAIHRTLKHTIELDYRI